MAKVIIYDTVDGLQTEKFLALLPKVQRKLYEHAQLMFLEATDILSLHKDKGHSYIGMEHGDVDYHVTLNDERGDYAAAIIEVETGALKGSIRQRRV